MSDKELLAERLKARVKEEVADRMEESEGSNADVKVSALSDELRVRLADVSKYVDKRKDYRAGYELALIRRCLVALADQKYDKCKLLLEEELKNLYIGLKFGWGALDDGDDAIWEISADEAKELRGRAKEARKEYLERSAKYSAKKFTLGTGAAVKAVGGKNRQTDPCFKCGRLGHWSKECTTRP